MVISLHIAKILLDYDFNFNQSYGRGSEAERRIMFAPFRLVLDKILSEIKTRITETGHMDDFIAKAQEINQMENKAKSFNNSINSSLNSSFCSFNEQPEISCNPGKYFDILFGLINQKKLIDAFDVAFPGFYYEHKINSTKSSDTIQNLQNMSAKIWAVMKNMFLILQHIKINVYIILDDFQVNQITVQYFFNALTLSGWTLAVCN